MDGLDHLIEFAARCNESGYTSDRLRALWIDYCIHEGLTVGTAEYDNVLFRIWYEIEQASRDLGLKYFDTYYDFVRTFCVKE